MIGSKNSRRFFDQSEKTPKTRWSIASNSYSALRTGYVYYVYDSSTDWFIKINKFLPIDHFWVPKTLTFKTRLRAKPFCWKWVICLNNYSQISGFTLSLALKQRLGHLGKGLFVAQGWIIYRCQLFIVDLGFNLHTSLHWVYQRR